MKRLMSLAAVGGILTLVAFTSLAAAAPPTRGRLVVTSTATKVVRATGISILTIEAPGTRRTTVYVPHGYRAPGGVGKVGNTVGKVTIFAKGAAGVPVTLNGTLTAVDQSGYAGTADQNCAGSTGAHTAVWLVTAKQAAGPATASFPVFVDSTAYTDPADAPWASYRLRFCAATATTPSLTITSVDLGLVKMFVTPTRLGMYYWRAVYDPTVPTASARSTTSVPGSAAAVSAVPVSTEVTARSTRISPKTVRVSGFVRIGKQGLGNVRVQVFVGHQRRIALNRPNRVVRTKADGTYSVLLRVPAGTRWLRVRASTPFRDITPGGGCTARPGVPKLAVKGCVDATLAPFTVVSHPVLRLGS